jgi:hypothetical protein
MVKDILVNGRKVVTWIKSLCTRGKIAAYTTIALFIDVRCLREFHASLSALIIKDLDKKDDHSKVTIVTYENL